MGGVVPHGVDGGAPVEPVVDGRQLPLAEPAVQVPTVIEIDLKSKSNLKTNFQTNTLLKMAILTP